MTASLDVFLLLTNAERVDCGSEEVMCFIHHDKLLSVACNRFKLISDVLLKVASVVVSNEFNIFLEFFDVYVAAVAREQVKSQLRFIELSYIVFKF